MSLHVVSDLESRKSPELARTAKLLKESPYFIGHSDGAELWEKQQLFLALAGLMPVSEVYAGHAETAEGGRIEQVADDPHELGKFLESLGLAYQLVTEPELTLVTAGRDPAKVDQFVRSQSDVERGRLLGYPETAVQAFVHGDLLSGKEDREILDRAGLGDPFFAFSRDHYADEIAVLREWKQALTTYELGE